MPHSIAPLSGHKSQAKAKDASATRSTKALSSRLSKQTDPVSCNNLSETGQMTAFTKQQLPKSIRTDMPLLDVFPIAELSANSKFGTSAYSTS
jgi:hypothetical protein